MDCYMLCQGSSMHIGMAPRTHSTNISGKKGKGGKRRCQSVRPSGMFPYAVLMSFVSRSGWGKVARVGEAGRGDSAWWKVKGGGSLRPSGGAAGEDARAHCIRASPHPHAARYGSPLPHMDTIGRRGSPIGHISYQATRLPFASIARVA